MIAIESDLPLVSVQISSILAAYLTRSISYENNVYSVIHTDRCLCKTRDPLRETVHIILASREIMSRVCRVGSVLRANYTRMRHVR